MVRSGEDPGDAGFCFARLAAAVVDRDGIVVEWSAEAAAMLGLPASAVNGRPFRALLADMSKRSQMPDVPVGGVVELRHGSAGRLRAALYAVPLTGAAAPATAGIPAGAVTARTLLLFAPAEAAVEWGHGVSLLRALMRQGAMGLGIHGTDLCLEQTNVTPAMFGGPSYRPGQRLRDVLTEPHAAELEAVLLRVLRTGDPAFTQRQSVRDQRRGHRRWVLSLSAFRLEDADGLPTGVAAMIDDVTEQERIRRHRDLLHHAATRIDFSLDVHRTSQVLAEVVTNGLADLAAVDIAPSVLVGDEPPRTPARLGARLLRVAATGSTGPWPAGLLQVGSMHPQLRGSSEVRDIQRGEGVTLDRHAILQALGDEDLVRLLVPEDATSLVISPLYARGHLLGTVTAWRTGASDPFDASEAELLGDIASRAALGIDNARRYTREHRAAVALQERLLPHARADLPAAETAGVHRNSGGGTEVSGDWFDVIDLPSLRVAFVVGDVIGHGLGAAATMGRLRTAVQTFAELELDPGELLAHVEDLVQRMANETPASERDSVGATCLYAVYDPTTRRCTLASAGHPPPVMVGPDGAAEVLDVPPNPPLSAGAELFQSVTVDVAPGSVIALYTDGLLALDRYRGGRDVQRLRDQLAVRCRQGGGLPELGERLIADAEEAAQEAAAGSPADEAGPDGDDIALLLARTRTVSRDDVAGWQFPAELASVAAARTAVAGKLADWGLDELAFSTELVVSELTTNAIRYAGGPVALRLIRGDVLICEVTDPSNTQPRVVKAAATDEGGRGLFIVAQCTSRWGCRYGQQGKTIWTEQPLPAAPETRASAAPSGR
ncbi:SpoIIE family protein phosphatase [Streptomyces sp. V4-01]|uniref:SpoIIE family protein phosphatase n=1 Tax=Actinacidiphila polyblastidii TaxID=3110430 RepID=A0ABU7PHA7_9ACTN|nr:SpoIIE family protein phosphatase [Streptomyces sp. V4-01]